MAYRQHPCPQCDKVFTARTAAEASARWAEHWRDKHVNKKKGRRQS